MFQDIGKVSICAGSIAYSIFCKWPFEVSETISRQHPPLVVFAHNLSEYLNCLIL